MVTVKTPQEIEIIREGGRRLARILNIVSGRAVAGVSAKELDALAFELITKDGDKPSFLGYKGRRDKKSFPASLCVSVNEEIVHGVPAEDKIFREGDIVGLDLGLIHQGLYTDAAVTVGIGNVSAKAATLMEITKKALSVAIAAIHSGATVGDIGFAVQNFVLPHNFGIIRELAGHGVGYAVHEEPFIPNFGKRGEGVELQSGMVIAIEPMLSEGNPALTLAADGFTFKVADGSFVAHFEHTVVVTRKGAEVMTAV